MFERFDEDASRALFFARVHTSVRRGRALGHKDIRPAHLLLGLLCQEGTAAWQALMDAGVTLRGVREAMARDTDAS